MKTCLLRVYHRRRLMLVTSGAERSLQTDMQEKQRLGTIAELVDLLPVASPAVSKGDTSHQRFTDPDNNRQTTVGLRPRASEPSGPFSARLGLLRMHLAGWAL